MNPVLRLVAVVVALTLGACASIPIQGPVEEVPLGADSVGIDFAPEPPEDGASPTRLLDGFLLAMADPEGNYAVARQYLTPEAAAHWAPTEVAVYEGTVTGDELTATVEGATLGRIDAAGHFTLASASLNIDFGLERVEDQWRISAPPQQLLLSRFLFGRYYAKATVYFTSRVGQHVVPDLIHLPKTRLTPGSVIESLLSGPARGLQAAVTTAIPEGVALGPKGAIINEEGVVTVDFEGLDLGLSEDARRRIGAQLLWSLTSVSRVTGLMITVQGAAFALPGANAEGVLELATQQGYQVLSRAATNDLFGVRQGRPGRLNSTNTFLSWADPGIVASDLAVSHDGNMAGLIAEDRSLVLLGAPEGPWTQVSLQYTNLRSPQYVDGSLWLLGDMDDQTLLLALDLEGTVRSVSMDLPEGGRVVDFAVSPTQARIAMIVSLDGQDKLGMAVVRPGQALGLGPWQELPLRTSSGLLLDEYSSVAWSEETQLGISARIGGQKAVYLTALDGSSVEDLGSLGSSPEELTAMPRVGGGSLAVRAENGITWRYEARTRWTQATSELSAIAYAS